MKNTPLPLDLIFIDSDSQIVNIAKRARPFSEQTISSTDSAMYVLEVNAGFSDRQQIDESMRVTLAVATISALSPSYLIIDTDISMRSFVFVLLLTLAHGRLRSAIFFQL